MHSFEVPGQMPLPSLDVWTLKFLMGSLLVSIPELGPDQPLTTSPGTGRKSNLEPSTVILLTTIPDPL